jgi:hypothetical protein
MSVANVVSMEFESEQALQDFAVKYNEVAPIDYPRAEIIMFVKTDDQSGLGISIYPGEEAREAGNRQRS